LIENIIPYRESNTVDTETRWWCSKARVARAYAGAVKSNWVSRGRRSGVFHGTLNTGISLTNHE